MWVRLPQLAVIGDECMQKNNELEKIFDKIIVEGSKRPLPPPRPPVLHPRTGERTCHIGRMYSIFWEGANFLVYNNYTRNDEGLFSSYEGAMLAISNAETKGETIVGDVNL